MLIHWFLLMQVTVSAPEQFTFREHEPIELRADVTLEPGFSIAFRSWSVDKPAAGREYDGGNVFTVWAPPGTYSIEMDCLLINWDAKQFQKVKRVFVVHVQGARPPTPTPPTPPDPIPPGPQPITDPVTWIVILQNDSTTIKQAQELLHLRDNLPSQFLLTIAHAGDLDEDGKTSNVVAKYQPLAKDLPATFLVTKTGQVTRQFLFTTAKDVLEELK